MGHDEAGLPAVFRIDSVIPYKDSLVDMTLYAFASRDANGNWINSCLADAKGRRRGVALPGYIAPDGRHVPDSTFTLTCTSGAFGKCVLWGYVPWSKAADGTSLEPYHQVCSRMAHADYCGNGHSHTRNGTWIEMWDGKGIQKEEGAPGFRFEASWSPAEAVYLKRTRLPDIATLDSIAKECPERFAKIRVPSDTTGTGTALLYNRSR